jgi:hypothetical protein
MPVEESLAVCDAAIAESDCVAGHIGLEPANPSASCSRDTSTLRLPQQRLLSTCFGVATFLNA